MRRLVARRLIFAILLVAAASSAALLLTRLAPGDLTTELGPLRAARRGRAQLARGSIWIAAPLQQWALWTSRIVRLDFGQSYLYSRPVASLVTSAAVNTAILGVTALILATALGRRAGRVDRQPRRCVARARARALARVSVGAVAAHVAGARVHRGANGVASAWRDVVARAAGCVVERSAARRALAYAGTRAGPGPAADRHVRAVAVTGGCGGRAAAVRRGGQGSRGFPPAAGLASRLARGPAADLRRLRPGGGRLALGIVRGGIRDGVAGSRPPDVRGSAGARHLPRGRVRRHGGDVAGDRHARRRCAAGPVPIRASRESHAA